MGLLLVVNLHGLINTPREARRALIEMQVERKFSATVVTDDPQTMGELKRCKDYVAWSPVDQELLSALLKSRGKVSETRVLDDKALKDLGYKKHEELAGAMMKEGKRLSAVEGLRPFFKLSPPRGGFKVSTRRQARQKGVLGKNDKLPEIVRRML
jgi:large subunit ribosomal protein L30